MRFKINYSVVLYQLFILFILFVDISIFGIKKSYSYNCHGNNCIIDSDAINHGYYYNGDEIRVHGDRKLTIASPVNINSSKVTIVSYGGDGAKLLIQNGASLKTPWMNIWSESNAINTELNNAGTLEVDKLFGGFYFDDHHNMINKPGQYIINNSGNLKVNNFTNRGEVNFKGLGFTEINHIENTDSRAVFNNVGKLTSKRILNQRLAKFTNDGDLKADEIVNIGEPNASSETVFTNNADIHAKKINNGDGKFVNGGNIASTEIINSGHKAVYENSGNINTNILRNRNGAKFVDNGTSNIKTLYNTDNGTDYRNIVKGVFDVIHNTDQAFFGNHYLLSANHIVNKAAFANGGDMSIVKWTNSENGTFTNDYLAKIGKIDNKSNAKIDNLGTLQSSVIHNYDNATFENKNALISNSFTNWNGGIFFNKSGSSARINTFKNSSKLNNHENADLTTDNLKNTDGGLIANSGNITVNNTMSLESGVLTNGGSGSFSSKILKIATLGLFQNEAGGTVTVDSITNNGNNTHGFANSGSLTVNSLVNNQNAHFTNEATGSSTIKSVYNNGQMSNHGVMDVMTFNNTGNFANKGNLTVDKLLRNKGTFTTTDTSIINTDKFVNEEGSHFVNSGYLTADTIYNRSNNFLSYGRIVSKMLSNAGKIDAVNNSKIETVSLNNLQGGIINNQNKITVSDVFVNSGSVNNGSNTGDIKSAKLLNELTGIFNNLGRLETGILHNRGKFNSTGGETILTTLQNDATGEFSNSGILYAKLINNAGNVFKNLVTGKIKTEDINNIGKVTNAGKLEVLKSLNNGGIFEIAGGVRQILLI